MADRTPLDDYPFSSGFAGGPEAVEPTLDQLLAEPIIRQVMGRDGVDEREIRNLAQRVGPGFPGMTGSRSAVPALPRHHKAIGRPAVGKVLKPTRDRVTGLASRRLLFETGDAALKRGTAFSIVAVVLAGLFAIGKRYGLSAAEHALRTVARRLDVVLAGDGVLAKLEGELLAMMTFDPTSEAVAERVCAEIRRPIPWGMIDLHLGAAVGVAKADGNASAESLLRAAYAAALMSLTQNPRGGVTVFTPELGRDVLREARVEERLWKAVKDGALSLVMQAKARAADGRIIGAESLVRWKDAELGLVPPSEFIPIAERTGIIGDLRAWVMRRSLTEAAAWQRAGLDLSIAVNISAADFRQPDLAADIRDALAKAGCDPRRLVIELTESALVDDPLHATAQLKALKEMGVSLSLDDFGTGYSSLSQLRRFPIDTLKIDRSFVADTPDDAEAAAIARTIVALAQSFGMATVAEGVETAAQREFLCGLGVDVLQGYLVGRPVPPDRFRTLAAAPVVLREEAR